MSANTKNMTQGSPGTLIFTFALPLMLGNIFQQLYTVVDTMVVGKYLGVNALAALGASDWMNWMMLGIMQGFTQGFAILMAQEFGAKRYHRLRKVIGVSAILSSFFALFLLISGQFLARPVLLLLQTPDVILPDTLLYLRIMFMGIPIVMAYNLFACILRSMGDGTTPLQAMVVASITNIVLDFLFVMVFQWGIAGAAGATLLAQLVSGIFCLFHIRKIEIIHMSGEDFQIGQEMCLKLLGLGFPMAFQNCMIAVGGMILQFVINGVGVIFIAGYTATNKLYGILEIAAISYGYAMITYVGQNMGAAKYGRISQGMRSAVKIAMVTSIVIGGIMLLFGKIILSCFISGSPLEAEQTLQVAYRYLAIMSVFLPVLYILHVTRSAIQGMGNTLIPMISGIIEFIMRTGTVLILPFMIGENGIFIAEVAAWVGADVVLVFGYLYSVKKYCKESISHLPEQETAG